MDSRLDPNAPAFPTDSDGRPHPTSHPIHDLIKLQRLRDDILDGLHPDFAPPRLPDVEVSGSNGALIDLPVIKVAMERVDGPAKAASPMDEDRTLPDAPVSAPAAVVASPAAPATQSADQVMEEEHDDVDVDGDVIIVEPEVEALPALSTSVAELKPRVLDGSAPSQPLSRDQRAERRMSVSELDVAALPVVLGETPHTTPPPASIASSSNSSAPSAATSKPSQTYVLPSRPVDVQVIATGYAKGRIDNRPTAHSLNDVRPAPPTDPAATLASPSSVQAMNRWAPTAAPATAEAPVPRSPPPRAPLPVGRAGVSPPRAPAPNNRDRSPPRAPAPINRGRSPPRAPAPGYRGRSPPRAPAPYNRPRSPPRAPAPIDRTIGRVPAPIDQVLSPPRAPAPYSRPRSPPRAPAPTSRGRDSPPAPRASSSNGLERGDPRSAPSRWAPAPAAAAVSLPVTGPQSLASRLQIPRQPELPGPLGPPPIPPPPASRDMGLPQAPLAPQISGPAAPPLAPRLSAPAAPPLAPQIDMQATALGQSRLIDLTAQVRSDPRSAPSRWAAPTGGTSQSPPRQLSRALSPERRPEPRPVGSSRADYASQGRGGYPVPNARDGRDERRGPPAPFYAPEFRRDEPMYGRDGPLPPQYLDNRRDGPAPFGRQDERRDGPPPMRDEQHYDGPRPISYAPSGRPLFDDRIEGAPFDDRRYSADSRGQPPLPHSAGYARDRFYEGPPRSDYEYGYGPPPSLPGREREGDGGDYRDPVPYAGERYDAGRMSPRRPPPRDDRNVPYDSQRDMLLDNRRGPPLPLDDRRGPPQPYDDRRALSFIDDRRPPLFDDRRGPPPLDDRRGPPTPIDARRGPPPLQNDRGPPPSLMSDRGPPGIDRRGPPPVDARRGPPPMDDRRGPPPLDVRRDPFLGDRRGPPPLGTRDQYDIDRRGPPVMDERRSGDIDRRPFEGRDRIVPFSNAMMSDRGPSSAPFDARDRRGPPAPYSGDRGGPPPPFDHRRSPPPQFVHRPDDRGPPPPDRNGGYAPSGPGNVPMKRRNSFEGGPGNQGGFGYVNSRRGEERFGPGPGVGGPHAGNGRPYDARAGYDDRPPPPGPQSQQYDGPNGGKKGRKM